MKRLRPALALCLVWICAAIAHAAEAPTSGSPLAQKVLALDQRHVMVVAHRGGGYFAPEDTLAAIDLGAETGVDGVEMDVRRTTDGHYVLMHDETVDRTTNGTGKVGDLALAQIRALEVRWTPWEFIQRAQFPVPPDSPRFRHLRVPTLEEALDAARGRVFVTLDLKAEDVGGVARLVAERGALGEAVFKVNSVEEGETVRAVAPQAVLLARPDDEPRLNVMLEALHPPIVHLDDKLLDREVIERLDAAGALIWMNTLGKTDAVAIVAEGQHRRLSSQFGGALGSVLGSALQSHLRPYRSLAERGVDFIQTDNIVAVTEAMRGYRKPLPNQP